MSQNKKKPQKNLDDLLKDIEYFCSTQLKIEELEKKIRRLEFTMEMAYEDLNEISHLMGFMEKHLEEENMQLSKSIAVIHSTVAKVGIDLMEEL